MRLIAYRGDTKDVLMGVVTDEQVYPFMPLDQFYGDVAGALETAEETLATTAPQQFAKLRQLPPVPTTARIFCAGMNYREHVGEAEGTTPDKPAIFSRWYSTLCNSGDVVAIPPHEEGLDWEAELAVIIGTRLECASPEEAQRGFLGYTCFNDLSARTIQESNAHVVLGKNADNSGPIGPAVVTADDIPDTSGLRITTRVNGHVVQSGKTGEMIFGPAELASYISHYIPLRPGDVIATGTPGGVGISRTPPVLLQPGDTVEVDIAQIGSISNTIAAAAPGPTDCAAGDESVSFRWAR
jgi:2,4-didehydro-3-deoxy-L-rhamnonate hydrolase